MANLNDYMNGLFGNFAPSKHSPSPRVTPRPSTPPSATSPTRRRPTTPTTPTTPSTPTYSAQNPPPGFTSSQWTQLLNLGKTNSSLNDLIKQFTTSLSTPAADQTWRREMPKDNTQLLRQLSFNAGEIGMPGGYVGAIQKPAFGSTAQPVNNPDMATYGRTPGLGEATFFQQSMKGGMAPIAAMSPLGVPEGWNPGGSSSTDLKTQLEAYLKNMSSSSGSGSSVVMGRGPFNTHWKDPFGHVKPVNLKPA